MKTLVHSFDQAHHYTINKILLTNENEFIISGPDGESTSGTSLRSSILLPLAKRSNKLNNDNCRQQVYDFRRIGWIYQGLGLIPEAFYSTL